MDPVSLALGLIVLPGSLIQTMRELKDGLMRFQNSKNEIGDTIVRLEVLIQCTTKLQKIRDREGDKLWTEENGVTLWNDAMKMLLDTVARMQKSLAMLQKGSMRNRVSHAFGLDETREHEKDLSRTIDALSLALSVFTSEKQSRIEEGIANMQSTLGALPRRVASISTSSECNTIRGGPKVIPLGYQLDNVRVDPHFVTRPQYEDALEKGLLPVETDSPISRKLFVLYGLGGIGKTQLAVNFGLKHKPSFDSILFADGSSRDSLLKSYLVFYRQLIDLSSDWLTGEVVRDSKSLSPERCCDKLRHWLSLEENKRWLLIIDNVDKEPTENGGFDIRDFFPPGNQGSILITTRLVPLSHLGKSIKVDRMSEGEASALLSQHIGDRANFLTPRPSRSSQAEQFDATAVLLRKLDGLPLAISQAGRFMHSMNLMPSTYLDIYAESKRETMESLPDDCCSSETRRNSIRTTWSISVDSLHEKAEAGKDDPENNHFAAYRFLALFTYFHPADIRHDILRCGLIGCSIPQWFRSTMTSRFKFLRVIKILLDLSLIDNNVEEGSYSIHRLVHDWLSSYVSQDPDDELLRLALSAIAFSAPLVSFTRFTDKAQRAIIHAVHLYPRLLSAPRLNPIDYFVDYSAMDGETLTLVSELRGGNGGSNPRCWQLMKFDLALDGFMQLLRWCGRYSESNKILKAVTSNLSTEQDVTGQDQNPDVAASCGLILEYHCWQVALHAAEGRDDDHEDRVEKLVNQFQRHGSPSWAAKLRNMKALLLDGNGRKSEATVVRRFGAKLHGHW